jgi:SanA protein
MGTRIINRLRRLKKLFLRIALLSLILVGVLTLWTLTSRYRKYFFEPESLDKIPEKQVALVFGAGYWADGRLSDVLRDRMDAAIELYRAGKVQKLLLSGDNRVETYNEPAKMQEYALQQGVEESDIVLDYAGRRTYDTCYRASDIFQVAELILVTQRYHAARALETCKGLGLDVVVYLADRMPYVHIRWYWAREAPALWKTWWDLHIQHPLPVLGEPLPIQVETTTEIFLVSSSYLT